MSTEQKQIVDSMSSAARTMGRKGGLVAQSRRSAEVRRDIAMRGVRARQAKKHASFQGEAESKSTVNPSTT